MIRNPFSRRKRVSSTRRQKFLTLLKLSFESGVKDLRPRVLAYKEVNYEKHIYFYPGFCVSCHR